MPVTETQLFFSNETSENSVIADALVNGTTLSPVLDIRLANQQLHGKVRCYASGIQTPLPIQWLSPTHFQTRRPAEQPLPYGRSRYNCTAQATTPGQFHWLSQPWFNYRPNDGQRL